MPFNSQNFLVRGEEQLKKSDGFRLVGRAAELRTLSGILMRKSAHNVLLVGAGGVGCSALCLGLQARKSDPDVPFDIINKRLYWLDSDGLFASGDHAVISESFQKLVRILRRSKDSVLIVEDTRDFIEAARNNGCTNFINALMRDLKGGRFQAIFETRDNDLATVLKCHSDMQEIFTMIDLHEPNENALKEIVADASGTLSKHHRINIAPEAISTAIELTSKYRVSDMSLSRAQPERSLNLLDRALTSYRQRAHAEPPAISQMKAQLAQQSECGVDVSAIEDQLGEAEAQWLKDKDSLKVFYKNQRDGEELIRSLEQDLEIELKKAQERETELAEAGDDTPQKLSFSAQLKGSGFENRVITEIRQRISDAERAVAENLAKYEDLAAKINAKLLLDLPNVTAEFSAISGISADKLNQDERQKLLNLEKSLASRVFGQDHAVAKLAGAIRVAKSGLKEPDKPQAAFLYPGPSGVGKTEMAKALTSSLMDDERALLRFDMSEYMEKHAVAKLIGAPPGYEGYEAGGILTNSMRANPHVIILFDEIEKAHPDVFNVLLQVLDDGRLTDNRGLTVSFSEAIILMTTNIGQPHFLDRSLSFEEAAEETMRELDTVYRPEFLNRFNGRENIVCFNRLELPVIEMIAKRELEKINARIATQNAGLSVVMDEQAVADLCKDKYQPERGARGIPGYFVSRIYPIVARTILETPEAEGTLEITYRAGDGDVDIVMKARKAA